MKRLFDIVFSILLIIVLSPLLLLIAMYVRITIGKPVMFYQERTGLHMKSFKLYKFRTMSDEVLPNGEPLPDEQRLTKAGNILRMSSLDELPQLFNVLKGDMSLVGPRPLPSKYNPYYYEAERVRFTVRPGITGLAQISGRNMLSWQARFQCDRDYVERQSMWLDVVILFKTVNQVVVGKNNAVCPTMFVAELDRERRVSLKSKTM
ncbi:sugar transferase [Paenibacillus arenosi]|uniref:Sugar transferase n=1 Tax=Paenibacillus arenosi TaxID=2774142 RepID=A0ABR9AW20_9BACL|nr:sugar transferase [Paenibacillus arenosi]MBD8498324.1 sugar transferase [Paenibacillus arenosi]